MHLPTISPVSSPRETQQNSSTSVTAPHPAASENATSSSLSVATRDQREAHCHSVPESTLVLYHRFDEKSTIRHHVPFSYQEMFSLSSFSDLIHDYRRAGKQLIVAVLMTSDPTQSVTIARPGATNTSRAYFYDAAMLNRYLFKRVGGSISHRYSSQHPYAPLNPLTNTPITDQVEYYIVDVDESSLASPGSGSGSGSGSECDLKSSATATFIGTDYNYAFNQHLRDIFAKNRLENQRYVALHQHGLPSAVESDSEVEPAQPFENANIAAFEQGRPRIRVPFKKAVGLAIPLGWYIFALVNIFIAGIVVIHDDSSVSDTGIWYRGTLPFLHFIVDRTLALLYNVQERRAVMLVKVMCWLAYFVTPSLLYDSESDSFERAQATTMIAGSITFSLLTLLWYFQLRTTAQLV
jgi:Domain of unknown function (DUF5092)